VQYKRNNLHITHNDSKRFKHGVRTRITPLTRSQIIKWAEKRGKILGKALTIEAAAAEMIAIMDWLSYNGLPIDKEGCVMFRGQERI
jgi:hypothetical protein